MMHSYLVVILLAVLAGSVSRTGAQTLSGWEWSVRPDFQSKKAAESLSGAVCGGHTYERLPRTCRNHLRTAAGTYIGSGVGIRDMARVNNGILVLSGNVNGQNVDPPGIHFWSSVTGEPETLGKLPVVAAADAEAILLLEEVTDDARGIYRVLILYDGDRNGNPTEFKLVR
jgi:hypothetical protein